MAHATTINTLTGNLVSSLTGLSSGSNAREFRQRRDAATRTFRLHQFGRVNQFDVRNSYDGLIEKFDVLNREDLAEALKPRLEELGRLRGKWTPELLSFILQLSDRPVEKTQLDSLKALRPKTPDKILTWEEIIADDPLTEEGVWENVDFTAPDSEDDWVPETETRRRRKVKPSPSDAEEDREEIQSYVEQPHIQELQEIVRSQFWNDNQNIETFSELQIIREVLFMLRGLSCSLYGLSGLQAFSLSPKMENRIPSKLLDILRSLGDLGGSFGRLREWSKSSQQVPLLQTFQSSIAKYIRTFDAEATRLEFSFVSPSTPTTVSLTAVHDEIRSCARPLQRLTELVSKLPPTDKYPFACLEMLFDTVCLSQATAEHEVFKLSASIFFDCLQTYLRPVRAWMDQGELVTGDEVFFVAMSDKSSERSRIWHDQHALRTNAQGFLHAPRFLHPASQKIFNTGKSIVFLRELGNAVTGSAAPEPQLDLEHVCGDFNVGLAPPFQELFYAAFEEWIESKYNHASVDLKLAMVSTCGLWQSLDSLEYTYFSKDGSLFQAYAEAVFEKIDMRRRGWHDRFILAELAQSVFGAAPSLDPRRLTVRSVPGKDSNLSVKVLSRIVVEYNLPWPIMNVIPKSSMGVYQAIFTFLLQVYRSKYLLCRIHVKRTKASRDLASFENAVLLIRQRLNWFNDVLQSYLLEAVLDTATRDMRKSMAEADDIDTMANIHSAYISKIENQCLLAKNLQPIHQAVISLLDLAVVFSDTHSRNLARSTPPVTTQTTPKNHHRRKSASLALRLRKAANDSSSDDDGLGTDDDYDADAETGSRIEGSHTQKLEKIQVQYEKLLNFVIAGLKGVGRAGAEPAWEALAERLEWGSGAKRW
ncbi:hypothetical protein K402DRAFT_323773 [Aulographum hederae CBS 113979]|uniref:Spindle pole body component n=1 Tax=Aulographum hederae CBS 113979 TaxID=1176131 RepID=A0A6G1HDQ5_9PEZI|nr:hypothetical protein K402DRAFT_323773 [Aulographum hederae CBS 113979]